MTDNLDDLKRGTGYYRALRDDPFAFGCKFADRFERLLRHHKVPFTRTTDKYVKGGGDGGFDFKVGRYLIDVKGTDHSGDVHLLVERGKVTAHIYVLFSRTRLMGWATCDDVQKYKARPWPRKVHNHVVPAGELRDVMGLWALLKGEVR